MTKDSTVSLPGFAREDLDKLKDDLYAAGTKVKDNGDLVGALIVAARRSPIEAVAAVYKTYIAKEAAEKAKAADKLP